MTNLNNTFSLIYTKSLVLSGGSYEERQSAVQEIKESFLKKCPSASVYTLSEHIGKADRFLKAAKQEFPIRGREGMNLDQLNDSLLDWVGQTKGALVILPEADKLEKKEKGFFYETIGAFLAQQHALANKPPLRLLITLGGEFSLDIKKIPILLGGDWTPSDKDLALISIPFKS